MTSASAIPASLLCVDTDPAVARDIAGFLPACETVSALDGYNALREINSRSSNAPRCCSGAMAVR